MSVLLKDITVIQTGLFAKPSGSGEVVYLQARHFDEYGRLFTELHPDLRAEGISDKHLLKNGDVLFASKGTKNFAAIYESHNRPAVASTSFFVIRLVDQKVLPEYLSWFLNSPSAQARIKGQAIGTSIPSISKQVLLNLEISVPDMVTQKTILAIAMLRDKEKEIKQEIESLREVQIQQQIMNAIK